MTIDSKRPGRTAQMTVGDATAGGHLVIANEIGVLIVQNMAVAKEVSTPPQAAPSSLPPDDPRVHHTLAALAHFRRPETCIYLGRRYGLTPQAPAPGLFDGLEIGAEPPPTGSLAEAVGWLSQQSGLTAARRHLNERYSRLDDTEPAAEEELQALAAQTRGRVLVTGSYSARIQTALGPDLTVISGDEQVDGRLTPGRSRRAHLLMLHGTEHSFQNAMVTEDDVANYSFYRPRLVAEVSELFEHPWIVFGAEKRVDTTFYLLVNTVCRRLGDPQRPIFVVDPRPEDVVAKEWPRAALRHVGLTPLQFLSLARPDDDA